jgi:hypothetical protein
LKAAEDGMDDHNYHNVELLPDGDMTPEKIMAELSEIDPEMMLVDGFEEAVIGYVTMFTKTVALYDRAKCLDILMKRDGMDYSGAIEFFDHNVIGAYVGQLTPAFATILRK